MTDNSNFVLRWVIANATAVHTIGKAESGIFNEGGFKWTAALERNTNLRDTMDFTLRCGVDHSRPWKCEAEVTLYGLRNDGTKFEKEKERFYFHKDNSFVKLSATPAWCCLITPMYTINDKFTVEFHIRITHSESAEPIADPDKFSAPNRMSNVILKIGEQKLHVCKELLAVQSPVLETLFFGNFAENGKEEVEIKDVDYEEFLDLLHLLYTPVAVITDYTVFHILKLADRFQMESVVKASEKHLIQSNEFDVVNKLLLADQYRLMNLRDRCLNSFTTVAELLGKLKSSPEYANFSDAMKLAIHGKTMTLKLQ